jgi:F-type H+-transporting ATPase subunit b
VLFDWFTVFAQIANFLILMWLLKRFLYKPVLNAIDMREKRIADLLKETKLNQQQVALKEAELIAKNDVFLSEREGLLTQAKSDAAQLKQHLLDVASIDTEKQHSQWLSGLQKEQQSFNQDISQRAQKEVFQVARKVLQDLSNTELETQILQVFIQQLMQLSSSQSKPFIANAMEPIVVRSAMVLSDANKDKLQQSIEKIFSIKLLLKFEVDTSLLGGIELVGSGHKLSWNIDDYLSNLEDSIDELVDNKVLQSNRQVLGKGELNASST